jgi:Tfp pilus assembly major pilin PilA
MAIIQAIPPMEAAIPSCKEAIMAERQALIVATVLGENIFTANRTNTKTLVDSPSFLVTGNNTIQITTMAATMHIRDHASSIAAEDGMTIPALHREDALNK